MHTHDTHATPADPAAAYEYMLALCRAIGELIAVPDDEPAPGAVTVYIPGWYETGGPWQLQRADGPLEWRVFRGGEHGRPAAEYPAGIALQFRDNIAGAAARMLAFDQDNPACASHAVWHVAVSAGV